MTPLNFPLPLPPSLLIFMDSEEQQRTMSVDEAIAGFATAEGAGTTRSASSNSVATPTPAPSSQTPGHPSFRR